MIWFCWIGLLAGYFVLPNLIWNLRAMAEAGGPDTGQVKVMNAAAAAWCVLLAATAPILPLAVLAAVMAFAHVSVVLAMIILL